MRRPAHKTAVILAGLLLAGLVSALSVPGARAGGPAYCAVVLESCPLRDPAGAPLGMVEPFSALDLVEKRGERLLVRAPRGRGLALLPRDKAAVVLGTAQSQRRRLARLKGAGLGPERTRRLMAGRIQVGDTLRQVELAWGRPQRSFMVNLIFDEQHYVYLLPGRRPVLLRFKAGLLAPPLAAPRRQDFLSRVPVEKPPTSR